AAPTKAALAEPAITALAAGPAEGRSRPGRARRSGLGLAIFTALRRSRPLLGRRLCAFGRGRRPGALAPPPALAAWATRAARRAGETPVGESGAEHLPEP